MTTLEISDELERKLRELAENTRQSVEETLAAIVDEKYATIATHEDPISLPREHMRRNLAAAGLLSEPISSEPVRYVSDDELRIMGRIPPGSPSSEELLREERDEE